MRGRPDRTEHAPIQYRAGAAEDGVLEAGRLLFARPCCFVAGAAAPEGMPAPTLPEVAFAGRSNVGKSSLVNALTGRRSLARTSNTPGRTRELNFFELHGRLMLVDLPGYGYAAAARKKIRAWTRLAEAYLRGRPTLRRRSVCCSTPGAASARPTRPSWTPSSRARCPSSRC